MQQGDRQGADARRDHKLRAVAATAGRVPLHEARNRQPTGPEQPAHAPTKRYVPGLRRFGELGLLAGELQPGVPVRRARGRVPVLRPERPGEPVRRPEPAGPGSVPGYRRAVRFPGRNGRHKPAAKELLGGGGGGPAERVPHRRQRAEPGARGLSFSTKLPWSASTTRGPHEDGVLLIGPRHPAADGRGSDLYIAKTRGTSTKAPAAVAAAGTEALKL
ncbi:Transcription factor bHLH62 [Zea mays]|uniref:Transcription factor bHLH62 n=1 Tax=Zea mays TaxID=4577 RepID=A0A1D6KJN7_MAIZE|nr:Transcription factor bHLH62 [Zea mays]ONM03147.1 Transcription factor bHLH62 [Zea mays]